MALTIVSASMLGTIVSAQVNIRPTPAPAITAENEGWYQRGEPIVFAGNLYYRAGAAIHFNPNEMVRSGAYEGVPLYTRTTIEPYSVVFVPIEGGRMQPFERPRSGELAGTSGSSVPVLPVEIPMADSAPSMLQAPAPPMVRSSANDLSTTAPTVPSASDGNAAFERQRASPHVGTTGRVEPPQPPLPVRRGAANGMFVDFNSSRWFTSGPPIPANSRALQRIGEYHGLPVYAAGKTSNSTIYIPVGRGIDALARFSKRPRSDRQR
jgi:hypothetical protein